MNERTKGSLLILTSAARVEHVASHRTHISNHMKKAYLPAS